MSKSTPSESTKERGDRFEEEVATLLRLMGFRVERDVLVSGTQTDMLAWAVGPFDNRCIIVECTDRAEPVGVPLLKEKAGLLVGLAAGKTRFQLMMVSRSGFTKEARAFAASNSLVDAISLRELESRLVDFGPYADSYIHDYERSRGMFREGQLAELNVDGSVTDRYVELSGRGVDGRPIASLHREVSAWQRAGRDKILFLLGEYGSGKTSFCRHFVYESLREWLGNQDQAVLPILINLRDCRGAFRISQAITETLQHRYGVRLASYGALERFCTSGRVLLVLDGVDEMAERSDERAITECFAQIQLVAEFDVPVLVSCRTNFFRSHMELLQHLRRLRVEVPEGPEEGAPLVPLKFEQQARILYVEHLSPQQVREYVSKRIGDGAAELISAMGRIHDLSDLSSRPVLLDMILSTLPALEASEQSVNSAALYQHYTDRWTARDQWRLAIPLEIRQALCEAIAVVMMGESIQQVSTAQLDEMLGRLVDKGTPVPDLERFSTDLQVCSFLVRNGTTGLRFAHKSFAEYFYGKWVADGLRLQLDQPSSASAPAKLERATIGSYSSSVFWHHEPLGLSRMELHTAHLFAYMYPHFSRTGQVSAKREQLIKDLADVLQASNLSATGAKLRLSEEIATFGVEHLTNCGVTIRTLLARVSAHADETSDLIIDLLRRWRPRSLSQADIDALRDCAFDPETSPGPVTVACIVLLRSSAGLGNGEFIAAFCDGRGSIVDARVHRAQSTAPPRGSLNTPGGVHIP